jgi:3-phosphoshikimate 1-carboxyvinyltransferase
MNLKLHKPTHIISSKIKLPGSKSISNRILIIKALSGLSFDIQNLSDSDDTKHLEEALNKCSNVVCPHCQGFAKSVRDQGTFEEKKDEFTCVNEHFFSKSNDEIGNYGQTLIDVGHAGTDMRFLTAFLSLKNGTFELTGSGRLQQRPVKDLVEVLQKLGADINYKNEEGYPPLLIKGKQLKGGKVEINGSVSSQFITSLLLIAPYFTDGLELTINNELVSAPYVDMTIELMKEFGASVNWKDRKITVEPIPYTYNKKEYLVESDWSAASYYYSIIALSKINMKLTISGLFNKSLQADSVCADIYKRFEVTTEYLGYEIIITKFQSSSNNEVFEYDFIQCPDIVQTLACTCIALKCPFSFSGLQTLKVKETDRIIALQNEFQKMGIKLIVSENTIQWTDNNSTVIPQQVSISTYNDHRMAMSFAPLCLVNNEIVIEDAEVVSKSYPLFWEHLKQVGINQTKV